MPTKTPAIAQAHRIKGKGRFIVQAKYGHEAALETVVHVNIVPVPTEIASHINLVKVDVLQGGVRLIDAARPANPPVLEELSWFGRVITVESHNE